jgi:hypothetical protein
MWLVDSLPCMEVGMFITVFTRARYRMSDPAEFTSHSFSRSRPSAPLILCAIFTQVSTKWHVL